MNKALKFIFLLVFTFCGSKLSYAQISNERIPGEIIIQFEEEVDVFHFIAWSKINLAVEFQCLSELQTDLNICHLSYPDESVNAEVLMHKLSALPEVKVVQYNHKVFEREVFPNDPYLDEQWSLEQINAPMAWEFTTGGTSNNERELVIAILDGGFETSHEDLNKNIWINQKEVPEDGIDNDGNGFVDDYQGWNFISQTDDHQNSLAGTSHGTSVAGIIGAVGDNELGVSGINWNIKMMLLSGLPTEAEIIKAYDYVYKMRESYNLSNGIEGAYVVASNLSLGIPRAKAEDHPIWCGMYELLGEQGVLNVGATDNSHIDVDAIGDMPTSCKSAFLISVTSTDQADSKSLNAAYGTKSIDLGSPGIDIFTTRPGNNYGIFSGTSAAAPLVAGAIALLYSSPCEKLANQALQIPMETAFLMREFILNGATKNEDLNLLVSSGGRLNLDQSLCLINTYCEPVDGVFYFDLAKNPISADESVVIKYRTSDKTELTDLFVYNMQGQMILSQKLTTSLFGERQQSIDTTGRLSKGSYFVIAVDSKNRRQGNVLVVF